ncbi:MAG: VOC family protein [Streptosporangiaceae bacterium]
MAKVPVLNHVGLTVRDIDASLAFWRDQLGFRELGRGVVQWEHLDRIIGLAGTHIEWVELEMPGVAFLELFAYRHPPNLPLPAGGMNRPGSIHICLEVQEIDDLVARLLAAGYQTRSKEVVTIPCGAYLGYKCVYLLDPDGVTVELSERPRLGTAAQPQN